MNTLNVALVQQRMQKDTQSNVDYILREIQTASSQGAELIILCELHSSLYFCQVESPENFKLAQRIPGPLTDTLSQCAKNNNVVIVGSIFEKRIESHYHNTAIVFEKNGEIAGIYRKMHIPNDPGYHEKYYFTPGDLGFKPIQTSLGKLGVMICWDQWFPEGARLMALAGAQVLIYPSAIGWDPRDSEAEQQSQNQAWQLIQQSHSIANNLSVICVNRVGFEKDLSGNTKGIEFWGQSFVTDTFGRVTAIASNKKEETILTSIDLDKTEQTRRIWPYLRDRRVDAYLNINKRFIDEIY